MPTGPVTGEAPDALATLTASLPLAPPTTAVGRLVTICADRSPVPLLVPLVLSSVSITRPVLDRPVRTRSGLPSPSMSPTEPAPGWSAAKLAGGENVPLPL